MFYAINTFKHQACIPHFPMLETVLAFDTRIGKELAAEIRKIIVRPKIGPFNLLYGSFYGAGAVVPMVRGLIDLASKDNTRTYQFQCTFDICTFGDPFVLRDTVLFDMRNFEVGCDELRARVGQYIKNTDYPKAPRIRASYLKMDKALLKWQARILA